jgi:phosphoenolpyruvate carboxykinase (GTP)
LTPAGEPWWEGKDGEPPEKAIDWRGQPWTPESETKAAHPNSRFTAPASQCPSISPKWEDPRGVPISAFIFGTRRSTLIPLVYEATDWRHGVYTAAMMASETTAAATGQVGVLRRDPMAMLPFCGYNMADYWAHWLDLGRRHRNLPRIFRVNWFRTNEHGRFLWPGFGENLRALEWILKRIHGEIDARPTPIGYLPNPGDIDMSGLNLIPGAEEILLKVDPKGLMEEMAGRDEFLAQFGDRCPAELRRIHEELREKLKTAG